MKRITTKSQKYPVKEGDKAYLVINSELIMMIHCHDNEQIQLCIHIPENQIENDELPF